MSVPTAGVWDRRAWAAGIVFVLALLAEAVISTGIPINQNDSAAKIARALQADKQTVLVAGYLSAVYAVAFVIYLATCTTVCAAFRSARASSTPWCSSAAC